MSDTPVLDRHYWRERAAAVLPSATAREIVRAARLLAAQYCEPTVLWDAYGSTLPEWKRGTIDPDAFNGREGGGVPEGSFSGTPDPYRARSHEVRADGLVGKRGRARVQGTVSSIDDLPNGATPALLAQMLRDLPRNSVGALAWDIEGLTHLFYSPDADLPELLGTDTVAYRQVVHAHPLADPYTARGVVGRETAVCKLQTWPTRTRLASVRIRKSEQAHAWQQAQAFNLTDGVAVWHDLHNAGPWQVREYPAPTDRPDRIHVGMRTIARGPVAARKARVKLDARTIGAVEIERADILATVAECLNRGERVVVKLNGETLTITRGKSAAGTYSLTTPAGKASGMRTPANVVKRATELLA